MKRYIVHLVGWCYRYIGAPICYLWDSEPIHDYFLDLGGWYANIPGVPWFIGLFCRVKSPLLESKVAGISFANPIGLAAGFDHEGQLPGMVHAIGFGFESIGTVTNGYYEGNPYPRIKRLVRSRSILVNKGLKSSGIHAVMTRIAGRAIRWQVPIGISIGPTNNPSIKSHDDAIQDIVSALKVVKEYQLPFSYIELNISCPNLNYEISFYEPEALDKLLSALEETGLTRPLFIKMPIHLDNEATTRILTCCLQHSVAAVTIGNLQHDRTEPSFDKKEIATYEGIKGNFGGKPCQSRSDELIKLAYPILKDKIAIVGCGGVFTADDAYRKIRNGASLIQLASATIFQGPQVAGEICADLPRLLKRDSYFSITSAIGANHLPSSK